MPLIKSSPTAKDLAIKIYPPSEKIKVDEVDKEEDDIVEQLPGIVKMNP